MTETGASKQNMERTIDKGAAQIRETSDRLNASTEETVKMFENSFASGVNAVQLEGLRVHSSKFAGHFHNAKQLVSAKSPAEMLELWSKFANSSKPSQSRPRNSRRSAKGVTTESAEPPHKAASLRP
jgi:hypothetical protein